MMLVSCKRCLMFEEDGGQLIATLQEYIKSIEEEYKVSREIYEKRLEACDSCESLMNGMCRFCGCFAAVRAVKKAMHCPHPDGEKW